MNSSYLPILLQVFQERVHLNPSYSMRSFARDLGMAPSTLSEVLNQKKGISPTKATAIAKALRLPDWQVSVFCDQVTEKHAKSAGARDRARIRLKGKFPDKAPLLSREKAEALASWIDLALLELTYMPNFESDTAWVAKTLGVPEMAVRDSVTRLNRAGLLQVEKGKWVDASPLLTTTDGVSSETIRNFHRSVLLLAMKKNEIADVNARTLKTVIFSVAKEDFLLAKEIMNEAVSKIVALADRKETRRDEVLCFSSQLFSLLEE